MLILGKPGERYIGTLCTIFGHLCSLKLVQNKSYRKGDTYVFKLLLVRSLFVVKGNPS